jgi:hypothetical protein
VSWDGFQTVISNNFKITQTKMSMNKTDTLNAHRLTGHKKEGGYTVYPFYKGCAIAQEEVKSVALYRDVAKKMILDGLRAGHTIADQVERYREQLDEIVASLSLHMPGEIDKSAVPGTDNDERGMLWCLNVMALEKMNALPSNDENGTMVLSTFVKE